MPFPLRVVSYNIRHGTNADDEATLDQIAEVLAFIDADLIALQEVDINMQRSQRQKQAGILAERLGMAWAFGEAMRFGEGSYGNAVLSRFPILHKQVHPLPDPLENRCLLEIHVQVEDQELGFLVVHLGLDHKQRIIHVQDTLLPVIRSFSGPLILCGDMNAQSDQEEIQLLQQELRDCFTANTGILENTYPAQQATERIDYILINDLIEVKQFYIVDSLASDHLPVVADLLVL